MNATNATILVGIGATALIDLWALLRRRLLGVALPNYAFVGRWIGHMRHGRFRHGAISTSAPVRHERAIGWTVHYLTGIAFAALLPVFWGTDWLLHPTLAPALSVGVLTVAAPLLLMQPAMGAGLAARHTPRPMHARLHSLATHTVFGLGLYTAARLVNAIGAVA